MQYQFLFRNISLSTEQEDYIKEKLDKLKKHIGGDPEVLQAKVQVSLKRSKESGTVVTMQVNITGGGVDLRAETGEETVQAAVDSCKDKLRRQLDK